MSDTNKQITLQEKKKFLLWFLKGRIENDAREISNRAKNIMEAPEDSWFELHLYSSDVLNKHLVQLNTVQNNSEDNINLLFERYESYFSGFIAWKRSPDYEK